MEQHMKYAEFMELVQNETKERLGKEAQIEIHRIVRNNAVILDGMSVGKPDGHITPTLYLNDFYKDYQDGITIKEIVDTIEQIYRNSKKQDGFNGSFYADFHNVKDRLACKLINRARNRELLKHVPYKEVMDLAMVAYYLFEDEELGTGTILVYNSHLINWQISGEEVLEIARKNTLNLLPAEFVGMQKILEKYQIHTEDELISGQEEPMYVLTNKEHYFGAACMMYDSVLQGIGRELEGDFWILPSSIHECIIVPRSVSLTGYELREMVREINRYEVDSEEYLSDEIYFYNRDVHKLISFSDKMKMEGSAFS